MCQGVATTKPGLSHPPDFDGRGRPHLEPSHDLPSTNCRPASSKGIRADVGGRLELCWIRDIREYQVVSGFKIRDGGIRGP